MSATVEFFDRTMMEAMALLAETRRYLIDRSESERKGMPIETGLAASMESMRLVARLTQVLAWLLYAAFATGLPVIATVAVIRSARAKGDLERALQWILGNRRVLASWICVVGGLALAADGIVTLATTT